MSDLDLAIHEVKSVLADREAVYEDCYIRHAKIMAILFPDGVPSNKGLRINIRYGFIHQIVNKLVRFCISALKEDGHPDSRLDLAGYAVRLLEVDRRQPTLAHLPKADLTTHKPMAYEQEVKGLCNQASQAQSPIL